VPELQRLRPDHEGQILAFETANRGYFAASVSDRGDEFFEHYPQRHRELLAKQQAGIGAFYVLVAEDGAIVGRFNLVFVEEGVAELGYRVAQKTASQGVATAGVRKLCLLAASRHGVSTLRAATSGGNIASQKVLQKAGFMPTGPADPSELGGKEGFWYQLKLTDESEQDSPTNPQVLR
jgi:ribosomal-protein-alanine N-acetyltransferase